MLDKIEITSDTKGKLVKIIKGVVYSDPLVFITELFQNSQRAKAKNVWISQNYNDSTFTFYDDGIGLKNIQDLLVLDYSSWETTDEGYGIGFWSVLAVPELETIEIMTNKWIITIDAKEILNNKLPAAKVEKINESNKGFQIKLKSQYFIDNYYSIKDRVVKDGELMTFPVYYNNKYIEKKDIFLDVDGDFLKDYNNKYFKARLSIKKDYEYPSIYYEKRLVKKLYEFSELSGVIELKKDALNLREPDRKDYNMDGKYGLFKQKIEEALRNLYLEFVSVSEQVLINKYAYNIDSVLKASDYEKFLVIEDKEMQNEMCKNVALNKLVQNINDIRNKNQMTFIEENISNLLNTITNNRYMWKEIGPDDGKSSGMKSITKENIQDADALVINGILYEKILKDEDTINNISNELITETENYKLTDVIKRYKRKVWVKAEEVSEYEELIGKAKYYKVKVLIAKNILYENVFEKHNIPHISELDNGLKRKCIIKNDVFKTKKERCFIRLLDRICEYFNLPYGTFKIANVEMIIETVLDNKVIDREIIKNTKYGIKISGLCKDGYIYLDRKALELRKFNIRKDCYGIHELKAVFSNITTIAHELAHLLYNTEDNTVHHLNKSIEIEEKIIELYM